MTLVYKPRPKMRMWVPSTPPQPRRNRFYLLAASGWILFTFSAYRWLKLQGEDLPFDQFVVSSTDAELAPDSESSRAVRGVAALPISRETPIPAPSAPTPESAPKWNGEILSCEEYIKKAGEPADNHLPAHLGRSALDAFVGENEWAKPCRRKHRFTARLCVAIQEGSVRGLSVYTSPPDLTLEICLREQASRLVLQPESTLRVVRTTLSL